MAIDRAPSVSPQLPSPSHNRIGDYAIIGDCRSAALIHRSGSLDWLCWPRFDSPSIFAAILDGERGGFWHIGPGSPARYQATRNYIDETNVLSTRFASSTGTCELIDLMPVMDEAAKRKVLVPDHELIREVRCLEGEVQVELIFYPRQQYAESAVRLRNLGRLGIQFENGRGAYYLHSSVPLTILPGKAVATFVLRRGESARFSLTYAEVSPIVLPPMESWVGRRIDETLAWWRAWAAQARYDGPHREAVVRSGLALKLLTYAPSGAVIAAASTSLPEQLGGSLNWDYRYCWLRDASLTTRALLGLGYYAEADAFMGWLLIATSLTQPELRIVYDVFGNNAPKERILEHFRGFRDSRPVRVGNAARKQIQLDVYGEVLDAAAQYAFHGGSFDRSMQKAMIGIGRHVAAHWNEPDQGIWEPRQQAQNHTHSRVLCWTALDRLISLSDKKCLENAPVDVFRRERDRIAAQVQQHGWNSHLNSYVSVLGGDKLDASLLLMSYYGFEAADSDRMRATYRAIRKELGVGDQLIRRYRGPIEGAFGICSFWEAEFLALRGGTLGQAEELFAHLLRYRNDVGLYAEEIDPRDGEALGNFPQAFTHVGLVSAALSLQERREGAKQLPHREPSAEQEKQAA